MTEQPATPAAGTAPARPGRKPSGLPFGAVMATGAACQLAPLTRLSALRTPLLALAIVIALGVTVAGAVRSARACRHRAVLSVWFGRFTVPVGCGVITVGLTALPAEGSLVAAWASTALAGAATVVVCVGAGIAARASQPTLAAVNGVWFIAPAAFLADAAALAALGARDSIASGLVWTALASVAIGTVGYAALLVVAAVRVVRHRLSGAPRVAWWIVTGCGGLAALALGRVADVFEASVPAAVPALRAAALACGIVAAVVLVPILAGCVAYLSHPPERLGPAPWPPAFSGGVFALGAAEIGRLYSWPTATVVGTVAAAATLGIWAVIAALNVAAAAAPVVGPRTRPSASTDPQPDPDPAAARDQEPPP